MNFRLLIRTSIVFLILSGLCICIPGCQKVKKIFIKPPPENVMRDMIAPENFRNILSIAQVQGMAECVYEPENRRLWEKGGGRGPIFCPTTIKLAGFEWKVDSFTIIKTGNFQEFFTTYAVVSGVVILMKVAGQAEKEGARVRIILDLEPSGSATPNLMDSFVAMSGMPRWMEKVLVDIKARVEGVG